MQRRSTSSRSSDLRPRIRQQQAADANFVNAIIQAAGTREKAFEETTKRGWRAINAGRMREAAQRFNQAFLLSPEQSGVYQGFAAIAAGALQGPRCRGRTVQDRAQAAVSDEGAQRRLWPFPLIAKRPSDAQPVLEQAVKDAPDFADAWTNLAWARFQNGDPAAACAAAEEAAKQRPSSQFRRRSDCGERPRAVQIAGTIHDTDPATPTFLPVPRPNLYRFNRDDPLHLRYATV